MALSRKGKVIIVLQPVFVVVIIIASVFATRTDTPGVRLLNKSQTALKSTLRPGEIRPIQFINLTSEVQGRIEEIYVKEGDKVEQGTQLVKLDPTQLESSREAQIAAYQTAQNESQVSRSQVIAAQNQLSQAQQGLNASQASVDTALQQVASARQMVVAAQTDIDKAQVDLNTAQRELKRTADLVEAGVESRAVFDAAKDRVAQAQVAVRNAEAR